MFLNGLFGGLDLRTMLIDILIRVPAVIVAITFHEVAHGWMANKCGDPTARMVGRLTLNPVKHFDLFGTLCMLFLGFGWAKPVPFNPANFKNIKSGTILVALAGPGMNLILAVIAFILYIALHVGMLLAGVQSQLLDILLLMIAAVYMLNLGFMVFNLLPIPPLDGSKVLFSLLPRKAYRFVLSYEQYGMIILLILVATGALSYPMSYILDSLNNGFGWAAGQIINLFL